MPNVPQEWKKVAQKFEEETYFRHYVGALNGRHFTLQSPIHADSDFYNKGTNSIVLTGVCDSNYCSLRENVGAQGRISKKKCSM